VQYRNDISLFLNGGVRFYWDPIRIRIGGEISIIQRNLKILETNIIDAVSRGKDAMDRNIYYGWFSQFGGQLELYEWVNFSFLFKDVGYFWGSKKLKSYIYIYPDRVPKVFFIPSITPKIWLFTLQIGPEWIWFFNENNQIEKQWIGTANVYLGPLRVLSGFRSGFLRTGVGLKLPTSDISIAQEWQNQIQENRFSERRFTLSGSWAI
jgi:hypothetical protein